MVEAGKVPVNSASKVSQNVFKALTGIKKEEAEKLTEKK